MRNVVQYFDLISRIVEFSRAEESELALEQLDALRGKIDGALYFADGSRLEFTERIAIEKSHTAKRFYRYQYVRAGVAIFRYDNAPHHTDISTFPHHKHIGRKTLSAAEPTLSQVLDEITELQQVAAGEAAKTPSRTAARKRQRKQRR